MKIAMKSPFTGKDHIKEINITEEQLARWRAGELIQNVVPHLSASDREFLMTGITAEEWEETFKDA